MLIITEFITEFSIYVMKIWQDSVSVDFLNEIY